MKKTIIDRRTFLKKFAKASSATLAVGVCVACPAPGPYYFYASIDNIGCDGETSYLETEKPTYSKALLLYFSGEVAQEVSPFVNLFNQNNEAVEVEKIWDKKYSSLKINYLSPLHYGETYRLKLSTKEIKDTEGNSLEDGYDTFFQITPIELSTCSVTLKESEESQIEVIEVHLSPTATENFEIIGVKPLDTYYFEPSNGKAIPQAQVDISIDYHTLKLSAITKGKRLFELSLKTADGKIHQREFFVEVI